MNSTVIRERYFEWLCEFVDEPHAYRRLLRCLYERTFVYTIDADRNRAVDGEDLRYRFAEECRVKDEDLYLLDWPCSVLEMMVALSIRIEDQIMCDKEYGDRTSLWFWNMLVNLGLAGMSDDRFDYDKATRVLDIFMSRTYDHDGNGGLFAVEGSPADLREVEIWYQMHQYLNLYFA